MLPYKELVPVYRPQSEDDANNYPDDPTHNEYIFIQPQDPTLALTDSSFSKTFRAFAEEGANFREMDEIEWNSKRMRLTGVQDFYFGGHPHLEISLELVL